MRVRGTLSNVRLFGRNEMEILLLIPGEAGNSSTSDGVADHPQLLSLGEAAGLFFAEVG